MDDKWLIAYEGVEEWLIYEGTLEQAVAYVKDSHRYMNYGHTCARIFKAQEVYYVGQGRYESIGI